MLVSVYLTAHVCIWLRREEVRFEVRVRPTPHSGVLGDLKFLNIFSTTEVMGIVIV